LRFLLGDIVERENEEGTSRKGNLLNPQWWREVCSSYFAGNGCKETCPRGRKTTIRKCGYNAQKGGNDYNKSANAVNRGEYNQPSRKGCPSNTYWKKNESILGSDPRK